MSVTAQGLVATARAWVGTPYRDQASRRGVGCHCTGLLVGVARELGIRAEARDDHEPEPSGEELLSYLRASCVRMPGVARLLDAPVGAIVAFDTRRDPGPHHVGIRTEVGMIHAWGAGDNGLVVEHELGARWPERFHSAWWHPEVHA